MSELEGEPFFCHMNRWIPASQRNCEHAEEFYDNKVRRCCRCLCCCASSMLTCNIFRHNQDVLTEIHVEEMDASELKVGVWVDCFCPENERWYEARVVQEKPDELKVHFHKVRCTWCCALLLCAPTAACNACTCLPSFSLLFCAVAE